MRVLKSSQIPAEARNERVSAVDLKNPSSPDTRMPEFEARLTAERFYRYHEGVDSSPKTIGAYRADLELLLEFLGEPFDIRGLTVQIIHEFFNSEVVRRGRSGKQRAATSINRTKAAIKSFCKYLVLTEVLPNDPARAITIKRAERKSPSTLTDAERKRVIREVRARKGNLALRDRTILEVFLATGIRLSELANLDIADVDLDGKHVAITAKGNREQTKFLNSHVRTILRKYLRWRTAQPAETTALFLSNRDSRLSTRQIQKRFTQWLGWAGITRPNLSIHSLRHTRRAYLRRLPWVGNSYEYTNEGCWRTVVSEENESGFKFGESHGDLIDFCDNSGRSVGHGRKTGVSNCDSGATVTSRKSFALAV